MKSVLPIVLGLSLSLANACGPEPVYNDDLGVTPVAVPKGSLAGTFALKSVVINIADFPLIGEQETGSEMYYLIERTFSDDDTYQEQYKVCGGRFYETTGGGSSIADSTWSTYIPAGTPEVTLDDDVGEYSVGRYVDTWGIELPDVYDTVFPADVEEANRSPHAERIFDADNDGNPGVTISIEGVIDGDTYFVQRRRGDFTGAVLSENEIVGINLFTRDQVILGSTSTFLDGTLEQFPHPDPLQSWFQQVRIDSTDCDEVLDAVEDRRLSNFRPFGPAQ